MFTDDPIQDFLRYDREQQRKLDKLPKCDICGEPLQDGYYYLINGEALCHDCLDNNYREEVEIED